MHWFRIACAFALGVVAVEAIRTGETSMFIGLACILAVLCATFLYGPIKAALGRCQVCERPLDDPKRAGDYALKYGVRACGDCGPKLDRRFGTDDPPDRPPIPPYMQ